MKIVILNKCFFSPRHVKRLRAIGPVVFYDNTSSERAAKTRLKGATVAVANGLFAPLTGRVLESARGLKLLVVNSTGFEFVDREAAARRGIAVANTPTFSTEAVAEHALALMLSCLRRIPRGDRMMRSRPFAVNPAARRHRALLGTTLRGKTLGIVGLGATGERFAELGRALGMNVLAWSRTRRARAGVRFVPLQKLLAESDVVSLHLPLTPETKHIISRKALARMKPTAILVNTARAGLVDERALFLALKKGRFAGAALDVIEKTLPRNPLLSLPEVVVSPHMAWWTQESLANQAETIVKTIEFFSRRRPANIVVRP